MQRYNLFLKLPTFLIPFYNYVGENAKCYIGILLKMMKNWFNKKSLCTFAFKHQE